MATIEKRISALELQLLPPRRCSVHVIDASGPQDDPDALTATYESDNPPGRRARLIVTLVDATQPKELP